MSDFLRWSVVALAMLTAGGSTTIMVRYLISAWHNGRRAPGRIMARHVVEVSSGTSGLVIGYGIASYAQLGGPEFVSPTGRLWLYMISLVLLLVGVIEVGVHQRRQQGTREGRNGADHLSAEPGGRGRAPNDVGRRPGAHRRGPEDQRTTDKDGTHDG